MILGLDRTDEFGQCTEDRKGHEELKKESGFLRDLRELLLEDS